MNAPLFSFAALVDKEFSRYTGALVVMGLALLLDSLGLNPGPTLTARELGFLVLVFAVAAVLASQFIRAFKGIELLKDDLELRVESRTKELETVLAEENVLSVGLSETNEKLRGAHEMAEKDLRIATRVQQGFFPREAPKTATWECAFAFLPAGGISGDFYDFYKRGNRLEGLALGDVSGHGIASGLITVLARSVFYRSFYERRQRTLGAVLEAINDELIPELADVENYLTAAMLRFDEDGKVEYVSAAHPDMLYRGADKARAMVLVPPGRKDFKGAPLGREGFVSPYTSVRFALKPEDCLLLYSDGLSEAKNVEGVEYGAAGVIESFSQAPRADAGTMLDYIMQEWRFHISGSKVADDVTVILIRRLG